eukprot:m.1661164 g.1661164  ORF g.1661164 m.1661164 type:complete len:50 (+) comp124102_c0_seq1:54-203(+)
MLCNESKTVHGSTLLHAADTNRASKGECTALNFITYETKYENLFMLTAF